MGLDDLVDCIEVLKERMQSHRAVLRENETRTRMALIDPLLCALGWNVADPGTVVPEYRVRGGLADYALLRPDGKPAAAVEAKRLGEALDSHRSQMLNYANMSGIEYAGLTDGNNWELYKVFQPGPLEERRVLNVSIADAPAHVSALELLLLWRSNLASGEPVPASIPIFEDHRPAPTLTRVEQVSVPRPASSNWIALSDYDPLRNTPCPLAIRFWDGSERPLVRWREILTGVVEKLYAEGRLTVDHLPIGQGGRTYSVHTEPVHPTGKQFENSKRIEGMPPLFVNVNLSALQIRRGTKRLLERYDLSPANVYLQVAQSGKV